MGINSLNGMANMPLFRCVRHRGTVFLYPCQEFCRCESSNPASHEIPDIASDDAVGVQPISRDALQRVLKIRPFQLCRSDNFRRGQIRDPEDQRELAHDIFDLFGVKLFSHDVSFENRPSL